jgi:hypothetical protein
MSTGRMVELRQFKDGSYEVIVEETDEPDPDGPPVSSVTTILYEGDDFPTAMEFVKEALGA